MGKSQTEALVGRGLRFSHNDRTVEVIKLFIIWHQQQTFSDKIKWFFNYLLLCFSKPVIGPWALQKNNALEFRHNEPIRVRVISATNTSHIIIISNGNWTDWSTIHIPNRTFLVRFGGISGELG